MWLVVVAARLMVVHGLICRLPLQLYVSLYSHLVMAGFLGSSHRRVIDLSLLDRADCTAAANPVGAAGGGNGVAVMSPDAMPFVNFSLARTWNV